MGVRGTEITKARREIVDGMELVIKEAMNGRGYDDGVNGNEDRDVIKMQGKILYLTLEDGLSFFVFLAVERGRPKLHEQPITQALQKDCCFCI